jgi:hypothetical protein
MFLSAAQKRENTESMIYSEVVIEQLPTRTKSKKKRIVSSKYFERKGFVPPSDYSDSSKPL